MKKFFGICLFMFAVCIPVMAYDYYGDGGLGQCNLPYVNGASNYSNEQIREQLRLYNALQAANNDEAELEKIYRDIRAGVYGKASQEALLRDEKRLKELQAKAKSLPTNNYNNYNSYSTPSFNTNTNANEAYYRCKSECAREASSCMQSARYYTDTIQRSQAIRQCSQVEQTCRSYCRY